MIIEKLSTPEPLELARLKEVLRSEGPCISLVLPPYHPGELAKSGAALLKASLQDAERQLGEGGVFQDAIRELLEPLEQLANDPASVAGSRWGRVIFRSSDVFCQFQLMQPPKPSLTVGGCFAVRRLLSELSLPRISYILALAKDSVRLFRCTYQGAEAVELPAGVPATLAGALELDYPDHDLENRSAIGVSTGSMHAVRFGTGSDREAEQAHLADFYRLVDRGIHKHIFRESEIPLVLAGVDEEVAAYRAISTYRHLVKEHLHGSPNLSSPEGETLMRACSLLRAEVQEQQAKALREAKEHMAPGHFSTDVHTIVGAALDGRVRELFLNESAETNDVFDRRPYRSWGKEDLLNLAVVETILHGGKAFEFPSRMMPDGAVALAIMRYWGQSVPVRLSAGVRVGHLGPAG